MWLGQKKCSQRHWYFSNREHWKKIYGTRTYKKSYTRISTTLTTNCTHGSPFGLCYEQYFVQIGTAIKMFNTGYISSLVQGAWKCTYRPHCVEFVYVCDKWCTDSTILILWWFTCAKYFTSSCAITVMCEFPNRDPCVRFVVSVV